MGTLPKATVDASAWVKVIPAATSGRVRNLTTNRCAIVRKAVGAPAPTETVEQIGEPIIGGTLDSEYSFGPMASAQDIWARSMDAAPCILHLEV